MARKKKDQEPADAVVAAPLTQEEEVAAVEAAKGETAPEPPAITHDKLEQIWERRFNNPNAAASVPIPIKKKGMTLRWVNTAIEGRHHRAVYEQGWQPVHISELVDPQSIPDLFKHPHGIVARGERGKEVLMMMPTEVYNRIQRRKAELFQKSLKNLRSELAGAAAQRFGSEAGDFVHSGRSHDGKIQAVGTVSFGVERVAADDAS